MSALSSLVPSATDAAITHLAFYTGWPKGFSAMGVAKNVAASAGDEA